MVLRFNDVLLYHCFQVSTVSDLVVLRFNDVLLYLIVNLLYIAVGQAPDAAAYNSGQQPVQPGVQPAGGYGQPIVGQPGVLGIYHMGPGMLFRLLGFMSIKTHSKICYNDQPRTPDV